MKKISFTLMLTAFMMMPFSSAQAQIDLGGILSGVSNASSGETSDLISGLTSIFSSDKQASKNNLAGTWVYEEPAIVFESDNFLTKAGGNIAAKKIEDKLQSYLTKYGIKPGAMKFTFEENGTFTEVLGTKTMHGTWKVEEGKLLLTYGKVKTISITTQVESGKLMFVTDATKLLEMFKQFGSRSTSSNIKTITSLMKNIKGMKVGLTLVKK